jgi:sarcosine oxidase, subunit alpha
MLEPLSDDPLDAGAIPHAGHRDITVAGVPCTAIRTGFVGEVAFELHHPRSSGPALWSELVRSGEPLGARPFGLDALELLRLEKGHVYIGQDTLPDDTPTKLGLGRGVDMTKAWFVGKAALERLSAMPDRRHLVGLAFEGGPADADALRGVPVTAGGDIVGRVTSAGRSPALKRSIGLAWIRTHDGELPADGLRAGDATAKVVPTPFYDPEGARLRG